MNPEPANLSASQPTNLPGRLTSIDAYRGFVMLLMMGEVLEFCRVSAALPASGFWKFLCAQQSHVEWIGCSLHDLIQPSFSFLVGVALPFSLARRSAAAQSQWQRTLHVLWRAGLLVLLGVFLRSIGKAETYWTFEDTLTQIGLGYGFLYLLTKKSGRVQWIALAILLIGYWLAFTLYPLPGPDFDWSKVGVPADWPHQLAGFSAHWDKNSNLAWAFDTWFLNLFPRETPFEYNEGGYATLSFIPTLGTMILGLIAGRTICSQRVAWAKVKWLALAGCLGLVAGAGLSWLGVCPIVKRIWTPSWVLFSGGWCLLIFAGFYLVIELLSCKRWAVPLVVIGMNSIAAYLIAHLTVSFISESLTTHIGQNPFRGCGPMYAPLLEGGLVLLIQWLILFWMYRRKLFLRV